jgi:outer membrane protein assembly factor BamB
MTGSLTKWLVNPSFQFSGKTMDSSMLKLAVILPLLLIGAEAWSQSRPVSTTMGCARAAGIVSAQGAVVLGTGTYTYDRYVSGTNFCALGETIEPAWVPTTDNPQCFVGYQCRLRTQPQGR